MYIAEDLINIIRIYNIVLDRHNISKDLNDL